jgi:GNAT superfamily N-acetyltransferase
MSQSRQVHIRPAIQADLPGIAEVLVDTWRSTFQELLPNDFPNGMSYAHQEERHRRTIQKPSVSYFVAETLNQDQIVGFASGGPNRHPELSYSGELYAIYVREGFQGQGLGKQLFHSIAWDLCRFGLSQMIVWVLANNPNRTFYERLGGRLLATKPITLGSATVQQVAYGWDHLKPEYAAYIR